jgi:hypothetical protein
MAIDSIGKTSSATATQRAQSASATSGLRNSPDVLNAITQTQQSSSNAVAPVKILAVPQPSKSGNSSTLKLPRGSLVDVVA